MMSSNSSMVVRRPLTFTEYWKSRPLEAGGCPIWPAAAWMFWSLMAMAISGPVTPSLASLSGRSHRRIE